MYDRYYHLIFAEKPDVFGQVAMAGFDKSCEQVRTGMTRR
jgi:hypothetical protein